jgi:putative transcriptional regulator
MSEASTPTPAELRAAREALGLSQREAGELIHAGMRTWQSWEYGKRTMPVAKWWLWQIEARSVLVEIEKQ